MSPLLGFLGNDHMANQLQSQLLRLDNKIELKKQPRQNNWRGCSDGVRTERLLCWGQTPQTCVPDLDGQVGLQDAVEENI